MGGGRHRFVGEVLPPYDDASVFLKITLSALQLTSMARLFRYDWGSASSSSSAAIVVLTVEGVLGFPLSLVPRSLNCALQQHDWPEDYVSSVASLCLLLVVSPLLSFLLVHLCSLRHANADEGDADVYKRKKTKEEGRKSGSIAKDDDDPYNYYRWWQKKGRFLTPSLFCRGNHQRNSSTGAVAGGGVQHGQCLQQREPEGGGEESEDSVKIIPCGGGGGDDDDASNEFYYEDRKRKGSTSLTSTDDSKRSSGARGSAPPAASRSTVRSSGRRSSRPLQPLVGRRLRSRNTGEHLISVRGIKKEEEEEEKGKGAPAEDMKKRKGGYKEEQMISRMMVELKRHLIRKELIAACLAIIFLMYPWHALYSFMLLRCESPVEGLPHPVLQHDMGVRCWSREHVLMVALVAVPTLVVFVVGVPAGAFSALCPLRRSPVLRSTRAQRKLELDENSQQKKEGISLLRMRHRSPPPRRNPAVPLSPSDTARKGKKAVTSMMAMMTMMRTSNPVAAAVARGAPATTTDGVVELFMQRLGAMGRHLLYHGYRPSCWPYEILVLARKLAMLLIVVFVPSQASQNRAALLLTVICIVIHLTVRPFENPRCNYLEAALLGLTFATHFMASFLLTAAESSGGQGQEVVSSCVAALNSLGFGIATAIVLWKMAESAKRRRSGETNNVMRTGGQILRHVAFCLSSRNMRMRRRLLQHSREWRSLHYRYNSNHGGQRLHQQQQEEEEGDDDGKGLQDGRYEQKGPLPTSTIELVQVEGFDMKKEGNRESETTTTTSVAFPKDAGRRSNNPPTPNDREYRPNLQHQQASKMPVIGYPKSSSSTSMMKHGSNSRHHPPRGGDGEDDDDDDDEKRQGGADSKRGGERKLLRLCRPALYGEGDNARSSHHIRDGGGIDDAQWQARCEQDLVHHVESGRPSSDSSTSRQQQQQSGDSRGSRARAENDSGDENAHGDDGDGKDRKVVKEEREEVADGSQPLFIPSLRLAEMKVEEWMQAHQGQQQPRLVRAVLPSHDISPKDGGNLYADTPPPPPTPSFPPPGSEAGADADPAASSLRRQASSINRERKGGEGALIGQQHAKGGDLLCTPLPSIEEAPHRSVESSKSSTFYLSPYSHSSISPPSSSLYRASSVASASSNCINRSSNKDGSLKKKVRFSEEAVVIIHDP